MARRGNHLHPPTPPPPSSCQDGATCSLWVTDPEKQGLPPAAHLQAVSPSLYCGRRSAFTVGLKCDRGQNRLF